MKKIAFYGKGGIGKSTTVSNLASALARQGYRVFQIGCDPKADSTVNHNGGERIPTILDVVRQGGGDDERDFLRISPSGVYCMEAGGPLPGTGCAGRGIIAAFEKLDELDVYEKYRPDFVLYDVLGDVVCGGFAMPLRSGYADELYIVTSGEMMSLYAASNIAQAVRNLRASGCAKLKGLILNKKNIEAEEELAKLHDLVAEPVTGRFFHSFAHLQSLLQHFTYCSSSSAMAWLYSSSLGATPCQPHWFSM